MAPAWSCRVRSVEVSARFCLTDPPGLDPLGIRAPRWIPGSRRSANQKHEDRQVSHARGRAPTVSIGLLRVAWRRRRLPLRAIGTRSSWTPRFGSPLGRDSRCDADPPAWGGGPSSTATRDCFTHEPRIPRALGAAEALGCSLRRRGERAAWPSLRCLARLVHRELPWRPPGERPLRLWCLRNRGRLIEMKTLGADAGFDSTIRSSGSSCSPSSRSGSCRTWR